jgi:hypothetical protein
MNILAIVDVAESASVERIRADLKSELRASWALFTSGVLREAYATERPTRVVFVLEAADVAAAQRALDGLPLVAAGQFRVELTEFRPFANWSLLFDSAGRD